MENPIFELEDLIDEYMDRFEENFPTYMVKHLSVSEKIRLVKRCLKDGKPYKPEPVKDGDVI